MAKGEGGARAAGSGRGWLAHAHRPGKGLRALLSRALIAIPLVACGLATEPADRPPAPGEIAREQRIPSGAIRMSPASDPHPPLVLVDGYEPPVPVPGAINTAGAEDAPFVTPDGNTLYFFFTPDASVPAEQQLLDGVTGIYVSQSVGGEWQEPSRVALSDSGELALDGCPFVLGDTLWFCTVRAGMQDVGWYTARLLDGRWQQWAPAELVDGPVGELHISADGTELYFHADRPGGLGGLDLWVAHLVDGRWREPINLTMLNTEESEGWPALSPDGSELWFYRSYAIWMSRRVAGEWEQAVPIISPLAGEPSVDAAGNVYFVHHYFQGDRMIEADIYVAYRR